MMDREHYTSYLREEANHEIARLESILRNPDSTREECDVARSMLNFYQDAKNQQLLPHSPEQDCRVQAASVCA